MLRQLLIFLVYTALIFGNEFSCAENIYLTRSDFLSQQEEKLSDNFFNKLNSNLQNVTRMSIMDASTLKGKNNIIIALGEKALDGVLHGTGNSPVIGVFISKESYNETIKRVTNNERTTAIYSDPSPKRQIALNKVIFGSQYPMGIIYSNESKHDYYDITQFANSIGVQVQPISINKYAHPSEISREFKKIKTLLLQKDKHLFDNISLDTLIFLAYDLNSVGIIGYSSDVVKSGALATTYTPLSDMSKSVEDMIIRMTKSNHVPPPEYPKYYKVIVNKYVSRSLNSITDDNIAIHKEIESLMREEK